MSNDDKQQQQQKKVYKRKPVAEPEAPATRNRFRSRAKTGIDGYLRVCGYYSGAHPGDLHTKRDITSERAVVDHWRLSMLMEENWPCVRTKSLGTGKLVFSSRYFIGRTEKFAPHFPWKGGVPAQTPFPALEPRTLDVLFQLSLHRELMRLPQDQVFACAHVCVYYVCVCVCRRCDSTSTALPRRSPSIARGTRSPSTGTSTPGWFRTAMWRSGGPWCLSPRTH